MVKKLLYHWYVSSDKWHWAYDLHLKNLEYYRDCFDKKQFVFTYFNEIVNRDALERITKRIKEIMPDAEIMTYDNDIWLREAKYFYNEVALKLSDFQKDEAIFFAHCKGRYSEFPENVEENKCWINMLYYANLNNMEMINNYLNDGTTCSIGTLGWRGMCERFEEEQLADTVKYKWVYIGAFYWFVPSRINELMMRNGDELPWVDRYFVENWVGHVIPDDDKYRKFIFNEWHLGQFISYFNSAFSEEDKIKFKRLYG